MHLQPVDPDSFPLDDVVGGTTTLWHNDVIAEVRNAVVAAVPAGQWAYSKAEIRWIDSGAVQRSLVPDLVVAPKHLRDEKRHFALPDMVRLVVEVEPRFSTSTRQYAELGIPVMWRIEEGPRVVEYRLTPDGSAEIVQTVTTGTFTTDVPFRVSIDLDTLR